MKFPDPPLRVAYYSVVMPSGRFWRCTVREIMVMVFVGRKT